MKGIIKGEDIVKKIFITFAAILLTGYSAQAALIVYQGAYGEPNGTSITAFSNWSGPSDYEVNGSGSLEYTDSLGNTLVTNGNSIRDVSSTLDYSGATYDFADQGGGVDFYVSFMYKSGPASSPRVILNPAPGGDSLYIDDDGSGDFRFRTAGGGVGQTSVVTDVARDADNFVIFKIDSTFGSGGTLHQVDFWLNPTDLSNIGAAHGSIFNLASASPELIGFESITFQSGSTGSTGSAFDELRIGTTLADVTPYTAVPEPASIAFFLGFTALGIIIMRHRMRC